MPVCPCYTAEEITPAASLAKGHWKNTKVEGAAHQNSLGEVEEVLPSQGQTLKGH